MHLGGFEKHAQAYLTRIVNALSLLESSSPSDAPAAVVALDNETSPGDDGPSFYGAATDDEEENDAHKLANKSETLRNAAIDLCIDANLTMKLLTLGYLHPESQTIPPVTHRDDRDNDDNNDGGSNTKLNQMRYSSSVSGDQVLESAANLVFRLSYRLSGAISIINATKNPKHVHVTLADVEKYNNGKFTDEDDEKFAGIRKHKSKDDVDENDDTSYPSVLNDVSVNFMANMNSGLSRIPGIVNNIAMHSGLLARYLWENVR